MKTPIITLATTIALLLAGPQSPSIAQHGGMHGGGQQPPTSHGQPGPQGQRPPDAWDELDKTMDAVQKKREREAEAERIERGGGEPRSDGPMSHRDRERDREHFLERHKANERKMAIVVKKRQKLVNDMLQMYSRQPSPGLKQAIERNSRKLSAERQELQRSRDFIRRND